MRAQPVRKLACPPYIASTAHTYNTWPATAVAQQLPSCAFASDDLGGMLKYHRATNITLHNVSAALVARYGQHNEVVVDSGVWPDGIVEAVFETADHDENARAAHADYLVQHGVTAAVFPLLKLDLALSRKGKPPFSVAVQTQQPKDEV